LRLPTSFLARGERPREHETASRRGVGGALREPARGQGSERWVLRRGVSKLMETPGARFGTGGGAAVGEAPTCGSSSGAYFCSQDRYQCLTAIITPKTAPRAMNNKKPFARLIRV
jgi:hypothetical protein